MTTMANLTVKKADNTTDIVWTALSASGGDSSPAVWRSDTVSGTPGQKPTFQFQAKWNQAKSVRQIDIQFRYGQVYTDSTTSLTQVRDIASFRGTWQLPQTITSSNLAEIAAQLGHLMAQQLIKDSTAAGYAPV